ncbi:uncharacterized protein LOC132618572 [Lycium barbarum]|uniref:uncharacterized protein LOC132618572 n=1 Tax=Lycium barbarum TaxID=112863 RepID=UPI00293E0E86|nr:uncharacterized protein LOC132618572 [Lycium barbarum]
MILRSINGARNPSYDPLYEPEYFTIKITHGGIMKHKPTRYHVGGHVDFIDDVNMTELKLSVFKSMVELCGYTNDSVTFWHEFGRLGDKMRHVSTDMEATVVAKNILKIE